MDLEFYSFTKQKFARVLEAQDVDVDALRDQWRHQWAALDDALFHWELIAAVEQEQKRKKRQKWIERGVQIALTFVWLACCAVFGSASLGGWPQ